MEHLFGNNKKSLQKMKTRGASHKGGGAHAPLGRAPYLMGRLETSRLQLQLYITAFGEKKIGEEGIITFYDTEPPPSPKLSRQG